MKCMSIGLRVQVQISFTAFLTLTWMVFTVFLWSWQDQDGSHIKGLLINFIHHNWPSLLRHNFLEEFITPIIKVHIVTTLTMIHWIDSLHSHFRWSNSDGALVDLVLQVFELISSPDRDPSMLLHLQHCHLVSNPRAEHCFVESCYWLLLVNGSTIW